jgi:type II secretory pathway component PulJ
MNSVRRNSCLRRYRALSPQVDPAQVQAWTVPIAAARMIEDFTNEKQASLRLVENGLGTAVSGHVKYSEQGVFHVSSPR